MLDIRRSAGPDRRITSAQERGGLGAATPYLSLPSAPSRWSRNAPDRLGRRGAGLSPNAREYRPRASPQCADRPAAACSRSRAGRPRLVLGHPHISTVMARRRGVVGSEVPVVRRSVPQPRPWHRTSDGVSGRRRRRRWRRCRWRAGRGTGSTPRRRCSRSTVTPSGGPMSTTSSPTCLVGCRSADSTSCSSRSGCHALVHLRISPTLPILTRRPFRGSGHTVGRTPAQ